LLMRVAFIGHPVHIQTRSADFFLDVLLRAGTDLIHFPSSQFVQMIHDGRPEVLEFDLYICWQNDDIAAALLAAGKRLILIPMYDDAILRSPDYWRLFARCKIISFCRALHELFCLMDLDSYYFQYFPAVEEATRAPETSIHLFFWERRPASPLNVRTIQKLVGRWPISLVHLHTARDDQLMEMAGLTSTTVDPRRHEPVFARAKLMSSRWFASQDEYLSALAHHNVFIAPRLDEGIGHSFLEAMARGLCVVAADRPTMNEYIYHDVNGLLYDSEQLGTEGYALEIPNSCSALGRQAREFVAEGHMRWKQDLDRLCAIISGEGGVARVPAQSYESQMRNNFRWSSPMTLPC